MTGQSAILPIKQTLINLIFIRLEATYIMYAGVKEKSDILITIHQFSIASVRYHARRVGNLTGVICYVARILMISITRPMHFRHDIIKSIIDANTGSEFPLQQLLCPAFLATRHSFA